MKKYLEISKNSVAHIHTQSVDKQQINSFYSRGVFFPYRKNTTLFCLHFRDYQDKPNKVV